MILRLIKASKVFIKQTMWYDIKNDWAGEQKKKRGGTLRKPFN